MMRRFMSAFRPDRRKRELILARLKARFAAVSSDVSMVDELIAERRAEAQKESER